jgi:hypothetical protein
MNNKGAFFILHSAFFISSAATLFAARSELPTTRTAPVPISGFDPFRRPCWAACGCRTQPLFLADCP